tara:strand:- start:745 stop:1113 length:369 start_codon:yes stop_codon:yes gene_type:complete
MIEFIKQPVVYEIVVSLSAILLYKIISGLFGIVEMYKYYKNFGHSCLSLVVATYTIALEGVHYKKRYMESIGLKEKHVEHVLKEDYRSLDEWKTRSIQILYSFSPYIFEDLVKEFAEQSDRK